jgi:hypothetical protein
MSRQSIATRATRRSDRRFAALKRLMSAPVVDGFRRIREGTDCLFRQSPNASISQTMRWRP